MAFLVVAGTAWAQEINSPPNVVGSGARALGMGGAFIAVADDATAASWNPGGLTQLERPEFSAVYSWKWHGEQYSETRFVDPEGDFELSLDDFNYLSFVYPIPRTIAGRNLVLSLNYQHLYDFDRAIDFGAQSNFILGFNNNRLSAWDYNVDVKYRQEGSLSTISPAFGFELTDRLSIGAVMNIWDSSLIPSNGWKTRYERKIRLTPISGGPTFSKSSVQEDYEDFRGTNFTFGMLYKPTERLSIGAVYHTKFTAHLKYTRIDRDLSGFFGPRVYKSNMRMEFPSAAGLGVAYRFPNDKLTMSLDVTRREWDQFVQIFRNHPAGLPHRVSPITGFDKNLSPHKATYTVRLGGEYVFVDTNKAKQDYLPSLRAGLFYDQNPASGRKATWYGVERGHGEPDEYYGVTLGLGVLVKNRVNVDLAYQYRWGNNVRGDTLAGDRGLPILRNVNAHLERGFHADVDEHELYLSTVIYF